jgi:hypothetical protein
MTQPFSLLARYGNGTQPPANPELELILNACKSEEARNAMRDMYYTMAGGDPKSFPVQFALLLTGHVSVMREAPDALRKVIAEEVQKIMGPLVAYQTSVKESAAAVEAHSAVSAEQVESIKVVVREELRHHRAASLQELTELRCLTANVESSTKKVGQQVESLSDIRANLIIFGFFLVYVAGAFTLPLIEWLRGVFQLLSK